MEAFAVANNNFGEAREWESLCRLYTCDEDSLIINHQDHLLLQQFSSYTNPNPNPNSHPHHLVSGTSNVVALDAVFDDPYSFFNCLSQENSSSTESDQAAGGVENGFLHDALIDQSMCCGNGEFMAPPMFPNDAGIMLEEMCLQLKTDIDSCQNEIDHHAKRKHEEPPGLHNQGNEIPRDISAKKKPRIPRDKSKRNLSPKFDKNGDENTNVQSSISSDENDCSNNASNAKANKGSKGPATDSQSLYARRRRERINERLRILQNLVPNGTKVDISTMLEEAVDYVKFLQLQIKLLSSDDMWMYAPIAYNGMDIGLYQKIAPNPCPQN